MSKSKSTILRRRIDSVFLFSAENSRCNGEPNDGGRPRVDPETDHLFWNDAALKRFVREGLLVEKGGVPGWAVQMQSMYPLNRTQTDALEALGIDVPSEEDKKKKGRKLSIEEKKQVLDWAAKNFADVRWFGTVMDTGYHCGNLVGPLQFMIAKSVHPATILEQAITRVTSTREDDFSEGKEREMGTKYVVPFALFRGAWFYTPSFGERTGFSVDDLEAFLEIWKRPFIYRQSAGLGAVSLRKSWTFLHDSPQGNEQIGQLIDRIQIDYDEVPRSMKDFDIHFNDSDLKKIGVQVYTEEMNDALLSEVRKNPGVSK